jgi:hypothetical protein
VFAAKAISAVHLLCFFLVLLGRARLEDMLPVATDEEGGAGFGRGEREWGSEAREAGGGGGGSARGRVRGGGSRGRGRLGGVGGGGCDTAVSRRGREEYWEDIVARIQSKDNWHEVILDADLTHVLSRYVMWARSVFDTRPGRVRPLDIRADGYRYQARIDLFLRKIDPEDSSHNDNGGFSNFNIWIQDQLVPGKFGLMRTVLCMWFWIWTVAKA